MFVTVCHHVSARNDESHVCHEIVFVRVRAEIRFEVEQEGRGCQLQNWIELLVELII